jgi:hypothetical protein
MTESPRLIEVNFPIILGFKNLPAFSKTHIVYKQLAAGKITFK